MVEGSFEPLSVIIVGIGKADFKKMEILDGDEVPLVSSTGKKRQRDLVQFVPFSKFKNDEKKLSNQVLEEIPRQIVDYYTINNLNPEKIKNLISANNNNNEMQYPNFDEENDLNLDKFPTYESIYMESNKNNYQKELYVSKQKFFDGKTYTSQPLDDDYNNSQNTDNFSLFNNNDK